MNLAPRELPGDPYSWRIEVLMALDCLANALLRGWHHETLSSRSWRAWCTGRIFGVVARPAIDALFFWQRRPGGHCQYHHLAEVARAEKIVRARNA